jgi:tRNA (guanine-N7-)-methyltransferase
MRVVDTELLTGYEVRVQGPRDSHAGLVGGDVDRRVDTARVPPLDLEHVLAPLRRPADAARLDEFIEGGPVELEIGFGRAHHLCDRATNQADVRILGFETKRPWCRGAARRAERLGLANLRVIEGDARPYMDRLLPDGCLQAMHVLFPDPWWKRRHHKRRLFSADFIFAVHRLLAPGGVFVTKTDVAPYADLIEAAVGAHPGFSLAATTTLDPVLAELPRSHREKKCRELGIPIFQYRYVKENGT